MYVGCVYVCMCVACMCVCMYVVCWYVCMYVVCMYAGMYVCCAFESASTWKWLCLKLQLKGHRFEVLLTSECS